MGKYRLILVIKWVSYGCISFSYFNRQLSNEHELFFPIRKFVLKNKTPFKHISLLQIKINAQILQHRKETIVYF